MRYSIFNNRPTENQEQEKQISCIMVLLEQYKNQLDKSSTTIWVSNQEYLKLQDRIRVFLAMEELIVALLKDKRGRLIVAAMYNPNITSSELVESLPASILNKSMEIRNFAVNERYALFSTSYIGLITFAVGAGLLILGCVLNPFSLGLTLAGSFLLLASSITALVGLPKSGIGCPNLLDPLEKFHDTIGYTYDNISNYYVFHDQVNQTKYSRNARDFLSTSHSSGKLNFRGLGINALKDEDVQQVTFNI